jgi:hypothetical protein
MKQILYCIILTGSFFSCIDREKTTQPFEKQRDSRFLLTEYYDKFRYHSLTNFAIDSIPFGERNNFYQQVDAAVLALIFKKSVPMHEIWLYHATFKDSTLITLLEESDEYGPVMWLVKFNEKGEYSDKTIIAMSSHDAADTWQRIGTYNYDSTFTVTSIYKIWNASKTKAVNIDTTYSKVALQGHIFKKAPILKI